MEGAERADGGDWRDPLQYVETAWYPYPPNVLTPLTISLATPLAASWYRPSERWLAMSRRLTPVRDDTSLVVA